MTMTAARRHLAAVMFADVAGYSAMMQASEPEAVAVRSRFEAVVREQHEAFGGKVVHFYGDGALTMFDSSVAAIQCAVEIQRQCREDPAVPLRIGVHAGDVLVDEHNVVGDAVNIASRIESFGVVGGILISDVVHEQVRNQPSLEFVGLGMFRLKNIGRPYEIFALAGHGLAVPEPELVRGKGERFASLPSNLPNPAAPLIGRESDVTALLDLVERERVVTITGPGGMGKTRLAIEVGQRAAARFLDGVSFVDLAAASAPGDFMPALGRALDIKEAEGRSTAEGVGALIGDKQALIVLDNFEQLIGAAADVAHIVERCPDLRVLITSQAPLRIAPERLYPLQPLSLPPSTGETDATTALSFPSVALFVSRARAIRPDFALTDDNAASVAAICRRLDGSPLAIGLAAARIGMLSPAALIERLDRALVVLTGGARDSSERHRTLRATIDWSHSLLTEPQQRLFSAMAVFRASADLVAIEAVCGSDGSVLDDLGSLVDMGLVQFDPASDRFTMLETIREYANEKLELSAGAAAVRRAHAEHFAHRAAAVAEGIEASDQVASVARGARDETEIRAALDYLLACGAAGDAVAAELGMRTCGQLWMFWHIRARHISARSYSQAFLGLDQANGKPSLGRAEALRLLNIALWTLGHFQEAIDAGLESYRIAEQFEAPRTTALAALMLGLGHVGIDLDKAHEWSDRAIEAAASNRLTWAEAIAKSLDGIIWAIAGDVEKAESRFAEALVVQTSLSDMQGSGLSLGGLALIANGGGDADRAIDLYAQAREAFVAVGDRAEEARVLSEMAWPYVATGEVSSARQTLLASVEAYSEIGSMRGVGTALIGLAALEAVEDRLTDAVAIATAADILAREEGVVNVYSLDTPGHEQVENARATLSVSETAEATARGSRLTLAEALSLARDHA